MSVERPGPRRSGPECEGLLDVLRSRPWAGQVRALGVQARAELVDWLGQAVIATDVRGRVCFWNPAAENLYGWSAAEAVGRLITDLTVPEGARDQGAQIMDRLRSGELWSGGLIVQDKEGRTFTALVTNTGILDEAGTVVGIVGVSTNVSELMRPVLAQSRDAAVVTGSDLVVRFATPAVERLFNWPESELAGRPLLTLVHPDDRGAVLAASRSALDDPTGVPVVEFRVLGPAATWTWAEALIANVVDEPSLNGLVWTLRDTTDHRAALDYMTDAALHDPLTGLPNRLLLADRINQATSRRNSHGAVLFIDLDGFKNVNDQLGHAAGDSLLRAVADRLSHTIREEDTCGRWAGDEFLVLNESLHGRAEAVALAERVNAALAAPLVIAGHQLQPKASIGIAVLHEGQDAEGVLRLADEDMYVVKQAHRDERAAAAALPSPRQQDDQGRFDPTVDG
jgi:diguanylate cyclase (GGDEF)-like protein/PAS domain S-box-containing protein